jgi:hypothetical protein
MSRMALITNLPSSVSSELKLISTGNFTDVEKRVYPQQ